MRIKLHNLLPRSLSSINIFKASCIDYSPIFGVFYQLDLLYSASSVNLSSINIFKARVGMRVSCVFCLLYIYMYGTRVCAIFLVELCDMKFFLCPMSWEFMSRYEHMSRYKLTYYRAMI